MKKSYYNTNDKLERTFKRHSKHDYKNKLEEFKFENDEDVSYEFSSTYEYEMDTD